jgi:hypothetical protein
MTRTMYDSITSSAIPPGSDFVAGYVDGIYEWSPADWALHPKAIHIPIAVFENTNLGIVGDCETGDMTPEGLVRWVVMRRNAGVHPTGYCSYSMWDTCRNTFSRFRVPEPQWWIADYDGDCRLFPGSIAKQCKNSFMLGFNADFSVVADYWPGVDIPPITGGFLDMPNPISNVRIDGTKDIYIPVPGPPGSTYYTIEHFNEKHDSTPVSLEKNIPGQWLNVIECGEFSTLQYFRGIGTNGEIYQVYWDTSKPELGWQGPIRIL